ncbi:uncharacterized protein GLRG_11816 [Colletotrichum graminicola M1.001]|uniref:Uncharacterized protein n=1 Tax=Colletotrichum graminicola (strain M1.001 / M2 / FGSC 10212) TaxID=645133 RepID=E3R0N2_COLGM|nr:uncharacterized protein GLRG_11816 [Colletotrichum graminicola M1.001]EFQ36670.1 hypothetical protein GLRG_11816 [Colletotrichum graminicola M1.001]
MRLETVLVNETRRSIPDLEKKFVKGHRRSYDQLRRPETGHGHGQAWGREGEVNNLGKAINGVFKSFKDVNLMMRYLRASSPARYSYIDIDKVKTKPLIASEITIKEALLWRMMGMPVIRTKNVNFDCYMYNSVVLEGEYEHKSRP